jgi:hypothetical protein
MKLNGPCIQIGNKVNVLFVVPVLAVLSVFCMPLEQSLSLNLCFIGGFACKYFS